MELYVHIPFCKQKCRYCSFTSHTATEAEYEEYADLLLREAENRKKEISDPVSTVYIGGGTPSLLSPALFYRLVSGLRRIFDFERVTEFTTEANPGTVTGEWLDSAVSCGVNRLSLGMQAAQDHLLSQLGRIHCFEDVRHSVSLARAAGINNLSLDLIFGIPNQRIQDWTDTLESALSLHPEHISAYGLIPEEGTPLYKDLEKGTLTLPDPDDERMMYDDALKRLSMNGFYQYEISNFARKGYECRHNIGYWTQIPYIGIGVSAASMTDITADGNGMSYIRRTNPDSLDAYREMVINHVLSASVESIDPAESRFETMMLGLRMNSGVSESDFLQKHAVTAESIFGSRLRMLEKKGLMTHEHGCWNLTRRGFDIQNSILVELMDD